MIGGSCPSCGAPITAKSGACVICALPLRRTEEPPPVIVKTAAGLPIPPQTATLIAVFALGFGGVVGSTLSGGLGQFFAAASEPPPAAPTLAADTPANDAPGPTGGSGSSGPSTSATPPAADTPVAPYVEPPPVVDPPLDPPLDPPAKPPKDEPDRVAGTVVHVNSEAGSYSVADGDGGLTTIHAKDLPDAGAKIKVPIETLFNTTSEEAGERKESGDAAAATFGGTVTYVDPRTGRYVLSSAGSSVVVTVPAGDDQAALPDLSSSITVDVDITPVEEQAAKRNRDRRDQDKRGQDSSAAEVTTPEAAGEQCVSEKAYPETPVVPTVELRQTSFTVDFKSLSYSYLEGIVQAVCDDQHQIVVSADDVRELGADLLLTVPKEIDPSLFEAGSSITAALNPTPSADGANDLWGIAGDDGVKGADDEDLGQGDLAG